MKLSEIKGERTIDVIADIIEPITNIAQDKKACEELFEKITPPQNIINDKDAVYAFSKQTLIERVKKHAPKLLKAHKRDIIAIFALIEGVDVEEYKNTLTLPKLVLGLIELLNDEVFQELFISARSETGDNFSTSAQENTGAQNA